MRVIGRCMDIKLLAPSDAYLSFFNSPYTGHTLGTAVDIYPAHGDWSGDFVSPVAGRVEMIKKMKMGRPREFPTEAHDFAIGIRPLEDHNKIVRIMHCTPEVSPGDEVEVGDNLGTALRSRYFNYWTGPHYHVDVMNRMDFNRSSKSLQIKAEFGRVTSSKISKKSNQGKYQVDILRVSDDNVVVSSEPLDKAETSLYSGLAATTGGNAQCIIDAGISHYSHGGIICRKKLTQGEVVRFQGAEIGIVDLSNPDLHHFRRTTILQCTLNGEMLRGLSTFLYPASAYSKNSFPLILVPAMYGQFRGLDEGQVAQLQINTIKGK